MKTMQNTNNDIRKRLDFSSEENKPKRQTTNIHMFLNQHQNKPKNFQSEPNMLSKDTTTLTVNQENNNTVLSSTQQDNTSPRKNGLPLPSTSEGNNNNEQKYAGGGYSKSPDPKSLGKPGLQSPFKNNSPPKREYNLNHNTSVPNLGNVGSNTSKSNNTSQSNVLRFDSETFFKSVNSSNSNLINNQSF